MGFTGCCPADGELDHVWREELEHETHELASPVFDELAATMKVLSNPLRIRILFLLTKKDHSVFELLYILKEPQNLLSYNLGVLKEAGLLESYYRSRHKTYRLADERKTKIIRCLRKILTQ